jgi:hypothetical protein
MTSDELELMIERTGIESLRFAASDDNPDEAQREAAREWVRKSAALAEWPPPCGECNEPKVDPEPGRIALAVTLKALRVGMGKCFYASPPACGCGGVVCHRLGGRFITVMDCVACLGLEGLNHGS